MNSGTGPRPEIGTDEEILGAGDVVRLTREAWGRFRSWLGRQTETSAAIIATAAIIIIWLGWAAVVMFRAFPGTGQIEKAGQFGDTFGAINALFTGLALVGLAYAASLQRKEVRAQEADAKENREAIRRQSREQYLTARLNATTALQNAYVVETSLGPDRAADGPPDFVRLAIAQRLRQRIAILMCETEIGFDRDWTPALEAEAASRYACSLLIEESGRIAAQNYHWAVMNTSVNFILDELDLLLRNTLRAHSPERSEVEGTISIIQNITQRQNPGVRVDVQSVVTHMMMRAEWTHARPKTR